MTGSLHGAAAAEPPAKIFRVGVRPRAGEFPAKKWLQKPARYRFDDPRRRFRVLYAAEQVETCWLEILADYRVDPAVAAEYARLGSRAAFVQRLPRKFAEVRDVATMRVNTRASFLDLRALQTRQSIRAALSPQIAALGLKDFDASIAMSRSYELTRAIARRAYEEDYAGIAYSSRLDPGQSCWAVFERPGTEVVILDEVPIGANDPALIRVLAEFELELG